MSNKGFTLIEVLLSVFIITVAVLGLYNGISYSFNSVEKAKDKFIAAYLAEEGLELVKNIRDSNFVANRANWKEGLNCVSCKMDINDTALNTINPTSPLLIDENGFYNYSSGTKTIFSRKIVISDVNDNKIKVSVIVYYADEEFLLEQYLYNWK